MKTAAFFKVIKPKTKKVILSSIANHYGISEGEAEKEVTSAGAENLLDYLTGSVRTATSLLMKKLALNF